MPLIAPQLTACAGLPDCSTDEGLARGYGIRVVFTGRAGGASVPPYDSLNLAAHVGDDPRAVDENRRRVLAAVEAGSLSGRVVTAQQVHGTRVARIAEADAGRGAFAAQGRPPMPETDGLLTLAPDVPLLMTYADCVPIVLVAPAPVRAVCVVHGGWRGILGGIVRSAAERLAHEAGCAPEGLLAYIGPHIGACCYAVAQGLVSQFTQRFGTICAVEGRLDLQVAAREDLRRARVPEESAVSEGSCTLHRSDRFFSYRAARVTGRHGALAMIAKAE